MGIWRSILLLEYWRSPCMGIIRGRGAYSRVGAKSGCMLNISRKNPGVFQVFLLIFPFFPGFFPFFPGDFTSTSNFNMLYNRRSLCTYVFSGYLYQSYLIHKQNVHTFKSGIWTITKKRINFTLFDHVWGKFWNLMIWMPPKHFSFTLFEWSFSPW